MVVNTRNLFSRLKRKGVENSNNTENEFKKDRSHLEFDVVDKRNIDFQKDTQDKNDASVISKKKSNLNKDLENNSTHQQVIKPNLLKQRNDDDDLDDLDDDSSSFKKRDFALSALRKEDSPNENLSQITSQNTQKTREEVPQPKPEQQQNLKTSQTNTPQRAFRREDANAPAKDGGFDGPVPTKEQVEKMFVTSSGHTSHDYISNHIAEMKNEKINFKTMKSKHICTHTQISSSSSSSSSSSTTGPNGVTISTASTSSTANEEEDSCLWEYSDYTETLSEKYMFYIIKEVEGVDVEDPQPPPKGQPGYDGSSNGSGQYMFTLTWPQIWKKIFTDTNRPWCGANPNLKARRLAPLPDKPVEFYGLLPTVKPNIHYRFYGFEEAAYMFDYLDYLFQRIVSRAFANFWEQCSELPPRIGVDDPYSAYNQALNYYYSLGNMKQKYKMPQKDDKESDLVSFISKVRKDFNEKDFILGMSIPKLATVYDKFRWSYNPSDGSFFKKLLDKYDYDGDGRLDAREFLFLTLWENRKYSLSNKIKYPFYRIVRKYILPIFVYADCDNDGLVSSEQLWNTFSQLKKGSNPQEQEYYNMFNCEFPNGAKRTASVNDFVLKNGEEIEGALNKEEFIKGILLGYWDRQTAGNIIFEKEKKDTKTLIDTRWGKDKTTDLMCQEITKFAKKAHGA